MLLNKLVQNQEHQAQHLQMLLTLLPKKNLNQLPIVQLLKFQMQLLRKILQQFNQQMLLLKLLVLQLYLMKSKMLTTSIFSDIFTLHHF
jgi:hypothetical protein